MADVARDQRAPPAAPRPAVSKRTWVRRGLVVALTLSLVAGLVVFAVRRALGPWVEVVAPARADLVQTIVASGRVASPGEVNVGSMLSGVIRALHAREGDRGNRSGPLLIGSSGSSKKAA
jgi:HlyD family secretion protein